MADPVPQPLKDPGPFEKRDTDLGKFFLAKFDVEYIPTAALLLTTFRARFDFDSSISLADQATFKRTVRKGVEWWDNSGFYLFTHNPAALNKTIRLGFRLIESPADYHKIIDVGKATPPGQDIPRPNVIIDLNITIDDKDDVTTLAHELGHVFGNYDEYRETNCWAKLISGIWHDDQFNDDTGALMNVGTEFRARYFDHFLRYVNEEFEDLDIRYAIAESAGVPRLQGPEVGQELPNENLILRLDYTFCNAGTFPLWGGANKRPGPTGA